MRCSSDVGKEAGGVWEKKVMQSATSAPFLKGGNRRDADGDEAS